jgi:hypothetical protein
MKRPKARRNARTVLDRLEEEGVISRPLAKRLRQARAADVAPTRADSVMVLVALLMPARTDARLAIKRNFAIAVEHAYYEAIGDSSAIKSTADAAGIPRRTVSNAVRNSWVPKWLIPAIAKTMRMPDASRPQNPVIQIQPIPARVRRELRQGLAKIRKSIPSPRARQ